MLSIADALYLLFVENMTCVVKHNPVRAYNHEWMCVLFAPLIRAGYFASVLGGVEESKLLLADARVDHVHMTGGKATHDAIVWGPGSAQREVNYLGKPITSELGAVTPYVIGPGEWSETELDHHARYFVTVMSQNNGCNCNAPRCSCCPRTSQGQVPWDGEGDPQEASARPAVLSWYAPSLPGLGRGPQGDSNDGVRRVGDQAAAWSFRPAAQLGLLGDPI